MSTTYFTSDPHYGHRNVVEFSNRPYADADEMNQALIDNWNARVLRDDDIGWILGDLAIDSQWRVGLEAASQLRGRLRLVTGNHDPVWVGKSDWMRHLKAYAGVFEVVTPWARTNIGPHQVLLSHFPYVGDHSREDRYDAYRLRPTGRPILHGHTHSPDQVSWCGDVPQIHVGVDAWGYRPVNAHVLEELLGNVVGNVAVKPQPFPDVAPDVVNT